MKLAGGLTGDGMLGGPVIVTMERKGEGNASAILASHLEHSTVMSVSNAFPNVFDCHSGTGANAGMRPESTNRMRLWMDELARYPVHVRE